MPQTSRKKSTGSSLSRRWRRFKRSVHGSISRGARAILSWSPLKRGIVGGAAALVVVAVILLIVLLPAKAPQEDAIQTVDTPIALAVSAEAVAFDWDTLAANEPAYTGDDNALTEQLENEELPPEEVEEEDDGTLKYGMENERVQQLQNRLMELGYLDIDESTQYYGSATRHAVKNFQRQCELDQDGIAGMITQTALYASDAPKYAIKEGMSGTDVESLQRKLKELGYMKKVTGYYGTETIEAVLQFQSRNKLDVDGLAGEQTFAMIYSPEAKPSADTVQAARRKANINTMIAVAKEQLGKKYILGAEGPKSFDCSGLVYYCLKEAGSNRGRYNAAGYSKVSDWEKISKMSDLEIGDLIFFYNNARTKVGHVGIYIGSGTMIDASSANGKVVRRSCTTSYWKNHFVCGRRPW